MRKYFEPFIWTVALAAIYFMNISGEGVSLCVFKFIGFQSCIGCGIAHSIHHLLHLNFSHSIHDHILGIPATTGILYNIIKPFIHFKTKLNNYGSTTIDYDATRYTA